MLDDLIEELTKNMLKDKFENINNKEEKYIITRQNLYEFSIKLIKLVKEVYDNEK